MCGICGYLNWDNREAFQQMLDAMYLRGPDEEGWHVEENMAIGIRRLSIIDVAGGQQPAVNEDGTVRAVLNGELYNYRQIRKELVEKGHVFKSHSDTEIIVHLYEEEKEQFVHKLRGMFGIALWDSNAQKMLVIRDRLGIKPLFFHELGETIIFASDLTALCRAMPQTSLRPQAVAEYIATLYVPAPGTIFYEAKQLMPGEMLIITPDSRKQWRYYTIPDIAAETGAVNEAELEEQFLQILRETVDLHLISDVPLGLLLSGGLDSGGMLAMMRKVTDGKIKTFSIGYKAQADHDFNETSLARKMAERFGADHTEELLEPDAVQLLLKVVEQMGEPFADSSALPTYLVSGVARQQVTVALSGIAGDELFGGYPRYLGMQTALRYQQIPGFVRSLLRGVAAFLPERGGHVDNLHRIKRFLNAGHLPLDQKYLRWITFIDQEYDGEVFNPEFSRQIHLDEFNFRYASLFNAWPSAVPADKSMGLDLQTYLPDDLLKMGDRLSMAHSLELRVPFCDHELLGFALSVPMHIRLKGWTLKSFMRNALRNELPADIINAPKRGFMLPIARWLREDLDEMVRDTLSESAIQKRGFLAYPYVKWILDEHRSGRRNFADQIFSFLMLELWLQHFESRKAS